MPRYNGINTDRLESFVRKLLGIRQGGIMPSLSPEPSVSINLPDDASLYGLAALIPWGSGKNIAAVAGQGAWLGIRNVSAAQLLVVRVRFGVAAVAPVFFGVTPTSSALGGAALVQSDMGFRDTRRDSATAFPTNSTVAIETGTAAAFPPVGTFNAVFGGIIPANGMVESPFVVVSPGNSLVVYTTTLNSQAFFGVDGFYRDALPDELDV